MNPFVRVPVPPVVVTATSTIPAEWLGVFAVIVEELATTMLVAGELPMVTVAPLMKLDPYMVTEVPPDVGPDVGEMLETVGAST